MTVSGTRFRGQGGGVRRRSDQPHTTRGDGGTDDRQWARRTHLHEDHEGVEEVEEELKVPRQHLGRRERVGAVARQAPAISSHHPLIFHEENKDEAAKGGGRAGQVGPPQPLHAKTTARKEQGDWGVSGRGTGLTWRPQRRSGPGSWRGSPGSGCSPGSGSAPRSSMRARRTPRPWACQAAACVSQVRRPVQSPPALITRSATRERSGYEGRYPLAQPLPTRLGSTYLASPATASSMSLALAAATILNPGKPRTGCGTSGLTRPRGHRSSSWGTPRALPTAPLHARRWGDPLEAASRG
jgi:hypothetical protein